MKPQICFSEFLRIKRLKGDNRTDNELVREYRQINNLPPYKKEKAEAATSTK